MIYEEVNYQAFRSRIIGLGIAGIETLDYSRVLVIQ